MFVVRGKRRPSRYSYRTDSDLFYRSRMFTSLVYVTWVDLSPYYLLHSPQFQPHFFFYSFFTAVISTSILSHTIFFPHVYKYLCSEIGCRNNFVTYICTPCIYCLCNKSILKKSSLPKTPRIAR